MPDPPTGPAPLEPPPGTSGAPPVRIGGFEILGKIGTGGMGVVYKARQMSLDRLVALKILPPHLEKDAEFMRRFVQEARATGQLNHPNIVSGIDVGQADGYWYFAMEFVDGESLRHILNRRGRLPEKEVIAIALQVAEGLAHAHAHRILHRDVKPENILIDREGTAKICDLGLARRLQSEHPGMTQDGTTMGTPSYLSPEQARGQKDLDPRTDIYSLGATLFHLAAGRPPFTGETAAVVMSKHLTEPAPDLARAVEGISRGLAAVVARCLQKNPADRYASMGDLIEDLKRLQQGQEPLAATIRSDLPRPQFPPPPSRPITVRAMARIAPARPPSPLPWIAAGLLAAAAAGLVLTLLSLPPRTEPPGRNAPPPPAAHSSPPSPPPPAALPVEPGPAAPGRPPRVAPEPRLSEARAAEARLRTAAGERAARGDFDGALAVWQDLPPDLEDLLKPRAEREIAALRSQAEARLTRVLDEAGQHLAAGDPRKGLRLLDDLKDLKYAAGEARLAALRDRLKRAVSDADRAARAAALKTAADAFSRHMEAFVTATCAGNLPSALRTAEEAGADPSLKPVEASVSALKEVANALRRDEDSLLDALAALRGQGPREFETRQGRLRGEVVGVTATDLRLRCETIVAGMETTYETAIKLADLAPAEIRRLLGNRPASTPAEHLARAARALAARDLGGAETSLKAAEGHPLAPPYLARLQVLRTEAAEAAAREAWESLVRLAGSGKLTAQKSKLIQDRLDAFEKDHGRTAFVASVAPEVLALKERLLGAGGGWKAIPLSALQVRRQGTATASVSGDILLVQVPPGAGNQATIPLLQHARDFRLRFEYRGDLLEMFLRKIRWHGAVLLLASPQGVVLRTYPSDAPNAAVPLPLDRPATAAAGVWHRVEISAVGAGLTCSLDGTVLCRDARLPAVARGEAHLLAWPGKTLEIRGLSAAVLDRQTVSGTAEGIVTDKGPDWIDFKEDGEDVPRRHEAARDPAGAPDPQVLKIIHGTITLNRARLSWRLDRGLLTVTGLEVLKPPQDSGFLVGTITFKQGHCIEIAPPGGAPPERLVPRWMGGLPAQGGGYDPKIVSELSKYGVGDKVRADWIYDDRKRLTGIAPAR